MTSHNDSTAISKDASETRGGMNETHLGEGNRYGEQETEFFSTMQFGSIEVVRSRLVGRPWRETDASSYFHVAAPLSMTRRPQHGLKYSLTSGGMHQDNLHNESVSVPSRLPTARTGMEELCLRIQDHSLEQDSKQHPGDSAYSSLRQDPEGRYAGLLDAERYGSSESMSEKLDTALRIAMQSAGVHPYGGSSTGLGLVSGTVSENGSSTKGFSSPYGSRESFQEHQTLPLDLQKTLKSTLWGKIEEPQLSYLLECNCVGKVLDGLVDYYNGKIQDLVEEQALEKEHLACRLETEACRTDALHRALQQLQGHYRKLFEQSTDVVSWSKVLRVDWKTSGLEYDVTRLALELFRSERNLLLCYAIHLKNCGQPPKDLNHLYLDRVHVEGQAKILLKRLLDMFRDRFNFGPQLDEGQAMKMPQLYQILDLPQPENYLSRRDEHLLMLFFERIRDMRKSNTDSLYKTFQGFSPPEPLLESNLLGVGTSDAVGARGNSSSIEASQLREQNAVLRTANFKQAKTIRHLEGQLRHLSSRWSHRRDHWDPSSDSRPLDQYQDSIDTRSDPLGTSTSDHRNLDLHQLYQREQALANHVRTLTQELEEDRGRLQSAERKVEELTMEKRQLEKQITERRKKYSSFLAKLRHIETGHESQVALLKARIAELELHQAVLMAPPVDPSQDSKASPPPW